MKEQPKLPKKPFIFYYVIVLLALMLINALIVPSLNQPTQVDYGTFLDWVDEDKVTQVELDQTAGTIYFIAPDDSGQDKIYATGIWPGDDTLYQRLHEKEDIQFNSVVPR